MTESTFSRVGTKPRGNGYTMVPHWLWTADLPHGAKILVGWLHSHADTFLAKITMNQCRRTLGSSQVPAWFDALEEAGLVAIERGANGKAARITLLDDAWQSPDEPRRNRRGDRAEIGSVTAPISARTEEQGENQGEQSSLRSDGGLKQLATRTREDAARLAVATAYWDWHVKTRNRAPSVKFPAIMAVGKKLLAADYSADEIVAAMQTASGMNQKAVQDEIHRLRRVADEAVGPPIPAALVRAFAAANPWLRERAVTLPEAALMQTVAWFVGTQQWGIGESMLRLAVALRAAPSDVTELRSAMWRAQVDRFPGELADYPDAMERAYRNQWWRAQ